MLRGVVLVEWRESSLCAGCAWVTGSACLFRVAGQLVLGVCPGVWLRLRLLFWLRV